MFRGTLSQTLEYASCRSQMNGTFDYRVDRRYTNEPPGNDLMPSKKEDLRILFLPIYCGRSPCLAFQLLCASFLNICDTHASAATYQLYFYRSMWPLMLLVCTISTQSFSAAGWFTHSHHLVRTNDGIFSSFGKPQITVTPCLIHAQFPHESQYFHQPARCHCCIEPVYRTIASEVLYVRISCLAVARTISFTDQMCAQ